jgi:mono/diheme cytochrome c family protein
VVLKRIPKKALKWSVVVVLAVMFVTSCGRGSSPRPQFVIAESKTIEASLFKQHCALCHGNEANGKEIAGVRVPTLRFGKAANVGYEDMFDQIRNGRFDQKRSGRTLMPAFKEQLTDEQIHGLVNFIMRDLQGRIVPE